MGGVFAETPDRVFLLQRGELPVPPQPFEGYPMASPATSGQPRLQNCILVVNREGKVVETWTQHDHLFQGGRGPHKVKISPYDPEKHVWIIDDLREQVFEFTHDGKQLVAASLGSNAGHCTPADLPGSGASPASVVRFDWTVPCPLAAAGVLTLDTGVLLDGVHQMQVTLDDAAGNSEPICRKLGIVKLARSQPAAAASSAGSTMRTRSSAAI